MIIINTLTFIREMLKRGMKQSHLDEHYDMKIFHVKNIPSKIKTQINTSKKILESGGNSYAIILKAKSKDVNSDLLEVKFAKLIKTNLLGDSSESASFIQNGQDINSQIVKIQIKDDDSTDDTDAGLVYGVCGITIK